MPVRGAWRLVAWIGLAIVALTSIGVVLMLLTDGGLGLLDDPDDELATYLAVFTLVFGDAIVAIFPGETTLNTASVLASDGELELALVIAVGFLGAFLGDNTLYWIARSVPALRARVDAAQESERFRQVLEKVSQNSFVLVIICRFLPFVRWGVVAGMGALPMPYGRFLLASAISAIVWSTYTCLMAYFIGTALADFPIASIALACVSSGILLGIVYVVWRHVHHARDEASVAV